MSDEDNDIDMEINEEPSFIDVYDVVEVDFDYEFDAARFFDFTRPESLYQARLSESWFDSAPTYPPSPFVAKLFKMEGFSSRNVDDSVSLVDDDDDDDDDMNPQGQYDYQDVPYKAKRNQVLWNVNNLQEPQKQTGCLFGGQSMGLSFYNHMAHDMKQPKSKSFAKPYMPRSSTLMKPTASQLAKQKQRQQAIDVRLKTGEGLTSSHCATENQAPKRQKLDGGLLHKIVDMKQPTILTHKVPKKDVAPQGMNIQSKLRITIPREPDLETALRAERIRSTSNKEGEKPTLTIGRSTSNKEGEKPTLTIGRSISNKEGEKPTSTIGRFKARPLNKKILEAPLSTNPKRSTPHVQDFQPFRFRSTERTKLASTAATTTLCQSTKGLNKSNATSTVEISKKDGNRCDSVDAPKLAERQFTHSFKARPLDRKILTSRGDLGVFRNNKRDVTVPKEFEFQTAKRTHQNPPVDLFSKLSLAGESRPKSFVQLQMPSKGSKENRRETCQQAPNLKFHSREIQETCRGKQIGELGLGNSFSRNSAMWR